jgi:hypothetical protein
VRIESAPCETRFGCDIVNSRSLETISSENPPRSFQQLSLRYLGLLLVLIHSL